jgi:hypothetical protein
MSGLVLCAKYINYPTALLYVILSSFLLLVDNLFIPEHGVFTFLIFFTLNFELYH